MPADVNTNPEGNHVLFLLLLAAPVLQGPKLTSAQAGTITRAVAEYLIPPGRSVGTHGVVGRTIVFDQAQSSRAFEPLVGHVDEGDITMTLPSLVLPRDKAVVCTTGKRDCTITRDAIFISIDRVERASPAEYRVVATLLYGEPKGGGHELKGGTYRLTVALQGEKWKHWEVIRSVPKPGL
ncbi:MAG: hypothetical protein ACRENQ_00475 [Gemmatimonadaceae bacterium]